MFDLKGRTALVTGGSRGLGEGICLRLAEAGANVAINYVSNHAAAADVAARIVSNGGRADAFRADATDDGEVSSLVEGVKAKFGSLDIVVANATCVQETKPIEEQTWDDYQKMMDFFVKSPFLLMRHAMADMKAKRYGRFINIGSEVVELGNASFAHYVAAKAALLGMTRSWARELGESGVTVNLIAPGWIPVERHLSWPKEAFEQYASGVPMKRQGCPADIGAAVAFLASEEANFITGQKIAVNGGNTLT